MTDLSDQLPIAVHFSDKFQDFREPSQLVRRPSAWDQDPVASAQKSICGLLRHLRAVVPIRLDD